MAIPEGYEKLAVIGIAYKGEYDPETEYHIMNAVYYEGSTYVALKEHPEGVPTADGANWMYLAKGFIQNMLDTVNAKDTSGLLGEPGGVVSAQTLMDKIADKMTKELVTNTALQNKLANYILKSQIVNNLLATQPGNPLDATQGKILADKFAQLNSELGPFKYVGSFDIVGKGVTTKIPLPGYGMYLFFAFQAGNLPITGLLLCKITDYIDSAYMQEIFAESAIKQNMTFSFSKNPEIAVSIKNTHDATMELNCYRFK